MNNQQKTIFLRKEGDKWYQRNEKAITSKNKPRNDEILKSMEFLGIKPKTVLEIGCASGWRLHAINKKYGATCFGIEPSKEAVLEGKKEFPRISLRQGTADRIPWRGGGI